MSLLVVGKLRYLSIVDQKIIAGDIYAHMSDDALSIYLGVMDFMLKLIKCFWIYRF